MEGRKQKIIYVDVDSIICDTVNIGDYKASKPITENIEKINKLYDEGNVIVYWDSRLYDLNDSDIKANTKKIIDSWGCKYSEIIVNRELIYDMLISDKSIKFDEL